MNNFLIDGSVYAFNSLEIIPDVKKRKTLLIEYAERISELYRIIIKTQPRNFRYFLAYRDIAFLRSCNFDLIQLNIYSELVSIYDNDEKSAINEMQILLREIYDRLKGYNFEYIEFEEWFKIFSIKYITEPIINNNTDEEAKYCLLEKNTINNIAVIAALNKYVYKNNDEILKLIYFGDVFKDNIKISADFNVYMLWYSEIINNRNIQYVYKISSFPDNDVIQVTNQNVKIALLEELEKGYTYSWNDDINIWNNKFNNIILGSECKISLDQYKNKIKTKQKEILNIYKNKVKNKQDTTEEKDMLKRIKNWKKQVMDIIYENIKGIDNFLDVNNPNTKKQKHERYNDCKNICSNILWCGANIKYFGVDCVDELKKHKDAQGIEWDDFRNERTINNKKYWHHIRPRNIDNENCGSEFWYFNLRIHFMWITSNKIEIGWIGRHLFIPCEDKKEKCNREDCPINPKSSLHDPNLSDYQNFLKQWE